MYVCGMIPRVLVGEIPNSFCLSVNTSPVLSMNRTSSSLYNKYVSTSFIMVSGDSVLRPVAAFTSLPTVISFLILPTSLIKHSHL